MTRNLIILLIAAIYSFSAHADNYDKFNSDGQSYKNFNNTSPDDKYRDWNKVLNNLASQGVDTEKVDWDRVDRACANLKSYPPTNQYNKCKYNNAIGGGKYQKDKTYCEASAQQAYFDYIKSGNNGHVINNYAGNTQKNRNRQNNNLNHAQEKEFKNSSMTLCMQKLGWNEDDFSSRNERE